ncbi:MAG TPA: T9SS type A sorting domain-containing protein [Adhaeribacter sp.]|nr:T9SS type A sorting domain-containing protein [Adhaeribacter sp.]
MDFGQPRIWSEYLEVPTPNLTASGTNLRIGDTFLVHETTVAAPHFTTAAAAGANQIWNFSALSSVATQQAAVVARNAAPKAGSYPAANMVIKVGAEFAYIENNGLVIKEHAAFQSVQNITLENTDPAEKLRFPLTYNDTFSDTFAGTVDLNGSTIPRNGNVTVTAEGYGTLVTPTGTYTNVLKVKTEEIANPMTLYSENTLTYDWFLPGVRFPLLRMTRRVTLPSTVFTAFYLDQVLGTKEDLAERLQFSVFPNPATETATIQFFSEKNTGATLSITNLTGQEVKRLERERWAAGSGSLTIDVSGLPKGIYLVRLETGGQVAVRRLLVQ